ncbi:DUF6300 family protein [Streptomyces bobili]|uniref:DUF6300 family protein n=1 Tax=Streptomyces bobili TaxID=67280 RepID=UPI00341CB160
MPGDPPKRRRATPRRWTASGSVPSLHPFHGPHRGHLPTLHDGDRGPGAPASAQHRSVHAPQCIARRARRAIRRTRSSPHGVSAGARSGADICTSAPSQFLGPPSIGVSPEDEQPARPCYRCGTDLLLHWHGPLMTGVWMELCPACDARRLRAHPVAAVGLDRVFRRCRRC